MYVLYSVLFGAWVVCMAPYFLYRAWRHQKYLPELRQRWGALPDTLKADGRPTVWIHSCSVGETLSVTPLAQALHARFPQVRLVFSTITKTGQAIAQERFTQYGAGNAFYFPIDLPGPVRRVLDWLKPSLLITIDTEIWPNVLHEAHTRGIPIVMANGRISAQSFQYYRWLQPLMAPVFRCYTLLMMKAPEDAARIQRMGARPSQIEISGNLKYDRSGVEREVSHSLAHALDTAFGLSQSSAPMIVAGSTHDTEEQALLDVLTHLRRMPGLEQTRLMLVPRHPERFGAVAQLAARMGFAVHRRSEPTPARGDEPVLVLDTLGELSTAYQFGTVVFVGGTLIPHGGQSIMEPAAYGRPIVIGPSMKNFPGIIDDFLTVGGVSQIAATESDPDAQRAQLTQAFAHLLTNADARNAMGRAAYSVFEGSQGATQFTLDHIAAILEEKLQL